LTKFNSRIFSQKGSSVRKVFLSVLLICSGFAVGCGSATFKDTAFTPCIPPVTTPTGANVLKIDVNGGPEVGVPGGGVYQNVPFATAEICAPGSTSNCVTISGLLVETGATGLRVFDNETFGKQGQRTGRPFLPNASMNAELRKLQVSFERSTCFG
jgi:hypothetical protein